MSAELPDGSAWLRESSMERRYVATIAIGLLAILALVATNQRSIFTPWDPGANPLLAPSAFFATPGRPFGGNRPVGNGGSRLPGVPGLPNGLAFATPGGSSPPITGDLPDAPVTIASTGNVPPLAPGQSPFAGLPIGPDGNRGAAPPLATIASGGVPPIGAVPEPATWAMLVLGFMMAGLALRRARRKAAPADQFRLS